MKVRKTENKGINVSCNLDKKSYQEFIKDVQLLAKKHESHSGLKLDYVISMKGMRTPYLKVKGWCSRNHNKKTGEITEILFMDMDGPILYWLVKEELKFLMNKYNLPPFYVFVSSKEQTNTDGHVYGNYLIINLKKNTFQESRDILKHSHCCDPSFKYVGGSNIYRTWVTRLGNKGTKNAPRFKEIIGDLSKTYDQEVSNAHLNVLEGLYKLPIVKYSNKDKSTVKDIYFNTYLTASGI